MNEPCVSALSAPDRLTAERPLARFGDLQPCDFNRLRDADHSLDGRGGESDTDQLRQLLGREAMQEHDRFGAARGSAASEQCNGHKGAGGFCLATPALRWLPADARRMPRADSAAGATCVILAGESRRTGLCSPVLTKWLRLRPPGLRPGPLAFPLTRSAPARFTAHVSHAAHASWNWRWALRGNFCGAGPPLDSPPMTQASPAGALTVRGSERRNYEW